jgi:hypothetical protein
MAARLAGPTAGMLSVLKWLGTLTGLAGAVMLALNISVSGWRWLLFALSAALWTWAGLAMREWSLAALQGGFLMVDLLGIWRWLIA